MTSCARPSFLLLLVAALANTSPAQEKQTEKKKFAVVWRKTVLDTKFRAEGVGVADINKDGKKDIIVGDLWYSAPDWKPNWIRRDKGKEKVYDGAKGYSEAFCVFTDDIDGDGYPDQIVMPMPIKPCYWYKNPGKDGGAWTEYLIQDSACNETPQYVDLFKTGKRGLLLGHKGEMCYFVPGMDPTKPWDRVSISGPAKNHPGTHHYAHGLGAGDVNGDGLLDVLCGPNPPGAIGGGWWEQPASNASKGNWVFHPASFPKVADMHVFDVDADGKNDIIATSAHNTGMWWFQQKASKDHPAFAQQLLFPLPPVKNLAPEGIKFTKEEADLFTAFNKVRGDQKKVPWRADLKLCQDARTAALLGASSEDKKIELSRPRYQGDVVVMHLAPLYLNGIDVAKEFLEKYPKARYPGLELGIGVFTAATGTKHVAILLGDRDQFVVPAQTHALHFVDINGDGLKDLVTGRRFWAHGPAGDDTPADPAFLYWFEAKKDKTGFTSFVPHLIDDDSGVGTQFAVEDVDGDGLLDIIIANKRGVFLFIQAREAIIERVPVVPDDN